MSPTERQLSLIIPDSSQIYVAPDFLVLRSWIASLRRNNLLHTTAPGYKV